ncbi:hypothetical protein N7499_003240 [Penicillium canescens]|uniref:Uncharacterized protein n=1 Tax=Penicillium canescens TaxID=5083 RepID=A0AAD6N5J8_PENCN|nr:uncharacterized protein N7446_014175 [Penicillium canescens]KAJ6018555.1 hypothetical protein N7522_002019 [Penicillium canescens]KAJ6034164.1 hypothetical protein N7460_009981 [Penicillium canescens]KAJ6038895.1 hypothetical protein N7446_014175 [Penicillium canescens]KAJ6066113.1 hypothetical protein N7444_000242 [Penicillium canescens]KAJ6091089.1 hypothetical protein N7499_003240 [Penicillium canescens]
MNTSNVTFDPINMYSNNPKEKTSIINLVISQAPAGAASATVVSGWHTSRSDRRRHCTVDYYDAAGGRISREHIV